MVSFYFFTTHNRRIKLTDNYHQLNSEKRSGKKAGEVDSIEQQEKGGVVVCTSSPHTIGESI